MTCFDSQTSVIVSYMYNWSEFEDTRMYRFCTIGVTYNNIHNVIKIWGLKTKEQQANTEKYVLKDLNDSDELT